MNERTPYGHIQLSWSHQHLLINVFGPFNLEGIKQSYEQIQDAVQASNFAQWTRIDLLDEETLGAPEVMKVIGASYKWCFANRCVGIASVCSTNIQRNMLEQFQAETQLNLIHMGSLDDALAWCERQYSMY